MSDKAYTPILPFNDLAMDHYVIYDSQPYVRNVALLDETTIRKHSPYMIKYYTTADIEPVNIGGD